jgi:hypothetical protein
MISAGSVCLLPFGLAPKKVVFDNAKHKEPVPIRSINCQHLAKIVVNISLSYTHVFKSLLNRKPKYRPRPFGTSSAETKTVVLLISEMGEVDADFGLEWEQKSFCSNLAALAYRSNFASTILLVNATGLVKAAAGSAEPCNPTDITSLRPRLLLDLTAQIKLLKEYWIRRREETPTWKTLVEAQATEVKFIDTLEYLRDYDTKGKFTDEESSKWKRLQLDVE